MDKTEEDSRQDNIGRYARWGGRVLSSFVYADGRLVSDIGEQQVASAVTAQAGT